MTMTRPQPFIVTLKLDTNTFALFEDLRQKYFPVARNVIPAHITLFHALPVEEETSLLASLDAVCSQTLVLKLSFPGLRLLGRGVAVDVLCPALLDLQKRLAAEWKQWLTPQDRQGFRPHITIQNMVRAVEARRLYDKLGSSWCPFTGKATGLLLWHYRGGPWKLAQEFLFGNKPAARVSA
jgi:2'-5' RNA ligase